MNKFKVPRSSSEGKCASCQSLCNDTNQLTTVNDTYGSGSSWWPFFFSAVFFNLIKRLSCAGDPDVILKCIVAGFFANAARIHHSGSYRWVSEFHPLSLLSDVCLIFVFHYSFIICFARTLRDDRELQIHPSSVLFGEKPPKWSVPIPSTLLLQNLLLCPNLVQQTWFSWALLFSYMNLTTIRKTFTLSPPGLSSMKWCRQQNTICAMWLLWSRPGWLSWPLTFTSRPR